MVTDHHLIALFALRLMAKGRENWYWDILFRVIEEKPLIFLVTSLYWRLRHPVSSRTLIARFTGPTWDPPGAGRWAPCRPHEPCYQGYRVTFEPYFNDMYSWQSIRASTSFTNTLFLLLHIFWCQLCFCVTCSTLTFYSTSKIKIAISIITMTS